QVPHAGVDPQRRAWPLAAIRRNPCVPRLRVARPSASPQPLPPWPRSPPPLAPRAPSLLEAASARWRAAAASPKPNRLLRVSLFAVVRLRQAALCSRAPHWRPASRGSQIRACLADMPSTAILLIGCSADFRQEYLARPASTSCSGPDALHRHARTGRF